MSSASRRAPHGGVGETPSLVGTLTGVGVGPGDPDLLTRRAMAVLEAADRVVAPTSAESLAGRAESVVRRALPDLAVTRLVFDMSSGQDEQRRLAAEARAASHRAAARALLPWLGAEERVAFVTLGDPNLYSTFPALVAALRGLGWDGGVATVPGITAFQAVAATSHTVLLDGTESLALVTALDGTDQLEEALGRPDQAVVIYKGGRHMEAIAGILAEHDRLDTAVLGELVGLADERVVPLREVVDRPASYLATVLVPPKASPK